MSDRLVYIGEAEFLERLTALEAKHAAVEARLALLERRAGPRDEDDVRVLLAMAATRIVDSRFSSGEVIRYARAIEDKKSELAAALEAADCESPRSLGRLFRRMEHRDVRGWMLRRVAKDNKGWIWILSICISTPGRA
jgi:hypothetical protein